MIFVETTVCSQNLNIPKPLVLIGQDSQAPSMLPVNRNQNEADSRLHEFAKIATSPQSPLMQSAPAKVWESRWVESGLPFIFMLMWYFCSVFERKNLWFFFFNDYFLWFYMREKERERVLNHYWLISHLDRIVFYLSGWIKWLHL